VPNPYDPDDPRDGHDADGDAGPDADRWRRRLGTVALVAVGLLVVEVSANASLGVAIACLKFGWDDARDAAWLRRVDPDRRRGRACSWMSLGVGSLRAGSTGFLAAVAIAAAAGIFGARWGWPKRLVAAQLVGAIGVGLAGVALASVFSLAAIHQAWRSGRKVWLGPETRRAREQGRWPPCGDQVSVARGNRAAPATTIAVAALVLIALVISVAVLAAITGRPGAAPRRLDGILGAAVGITLPIAAGVFALVLRDLLKDRVLARSPDECWPEDQSSSTGRPVDDLDFE